MLVSAVGDQCDVSIEPTVDGVVAGRLLSSV